jgi:hypothetical protein
MSTFELHHANERLRVGSAKNVVISAWFDSPQIEDLRRLDAYTKVVRQSYPRGIGLLNLIVSGTPRFSKEIREEVARQTAEDSDLGVAHVILLGGIVGATVRTFLTTAMLIGRPATPTKVFADVPAAASWLAQVLERGDVGWTVDELAALRSPIVG